MYSCCARSGPRVSYLDFSPAVLKVVAKQMFILAFVTCIARIRRDLTLDVTDAKMEGQMHYLTSPLNHAIPLLSEFYELCYVCMCKL